VEKYTHSIEAEDPTHSVNRFVLIFKREALVTKAAERKCVEEPVVKLLYGEVNILIISFPLANLNG